MFGQLRFDFGALVVVDVGWIRASTERITVTSAGPIACSATAAAVAGSRGGVGAPPSPRPGSTSAAAATRDRASPRDTRPTARTKSTVVRYPTVSAVPRESTSAITDSMSAQVECKQVSNADSSASSSASLPCHTAAVDMPPF